MRHLTLVQHTATPQRLDMSAFIPERLEGLTADAIRRMRLAVGRGSVEVGELFQVSGVPGMRLLIQPCAGNLDRLGARMRSGELIVAGSAGHHLGVQMQGGTLRVEGDTGDFAASALTGGHVDIRGHCGERLGAPPPGGLQGVAGGFVRVRGDCGARAGERQRRGLILLEGHAGPAVAARMIAGTLIVLGTAGAEVGREMRRGTLLLEQPPASLPATFTASNPYRIGFLNILLTELAGWDALPTGWADRSPVVERHIGDLACNGQGEVLVWT